MSQLKACYSLIGKYSGTSTFSFGILIIMIHRFILYMQEKWGNKKKGYISRYYIQLMTARQIIYTY